MLTVAGKPERAPKLIILAVRQCDTMAKLPLKYSIPIVDVIHALNSDIRVN